MKRAHFSRLACLAPTVLIVAGCQEPPPPEPKLLAEPTAIQIEKATTTYKLAVDARGTATELEKRRLSAFITDTAGSRPESLHATISGSSSEAQLHRVADLLVTDGVIASKIAIAPAKSAGTSSMVTISVDRYVAAAPECPPWSTGEVATNDNSTRANLGCANLSNLAAMVADPHDLVGGSTSRFGDGTTGAAAVQRYHEDKVKELPKVKEQFKVSGGQ